MAWGLAHLEITLAESDDVILHKIAVGALCAAVRRQCDPATGALLQKPSTGHMIGVNMRFERVEEPQPELFDQRRVAAHLLEDGVDNHRRSAAAVCKQVSVGGGGRVE